MAGRFHENCARARWTDDTRRLFHEPARPMLHTQCMPLGVLFMQSQAFFGADSAIHAELMKHFDRSAVEVHVACTKDEPSNPAVSAKRRISAIPDLHLRQTAFGP